MKCAQKVPETSLTSRFYQISPNKINLQDSHFSKGQNNSSYYYSLNLKKIEFQIMIILTNLKNSEYVYLLNGTVR